jgi:hypothetical protein
MENRMSQVDGFYPIITVQSVRVLRDEWASLNVKCGVEHGVLSHKFGVQHSPTKGSKWYAINLRVPGHGNWKATELFPCESEVTPLFRSVYVHNREVNALNYSFFESLARKGMVHDDFKCMAGLVPGCTITEQFLRFPLLALLIPNRAQVRETSPEAIRMLLDLTREHAANTPGSQLRRVVAKYSSLRLFQILGSSKHRTSQLIARASKDFPGYLHAKFRKPLTPPELNRALCRVDGGMYVHRDVFDLESSFARRFLEISRRTDTIQLEIPKVEGTTPAQTEALVRAASNPMSIVTGSPGVGKTWLVARFVVAMLYCGARVYLTAPTGVAAFRLYSEVRTVLLLAGKEGLCDTHVRWLTIHSLVKRSRDPFFGGSTRNVSCSSEASPDDFEAHAAGTWVCPESEEEDEEEEEDDCKLGPPEVKPARGAKVLVCDEVGMADLFIGNSFLGKALEMKLDSLLLVGDPRQLISVGPGSLLKDILACQGDLVPVTHLTQIMRQSSQCSIHHNALKIYEGSEFDVSTGDFSIRVLRSVTDTVLVDTVKVHIRDQAYEERPAVICQTNKIVMGLNDMLQAMYNPAPKKRKHNHVPATFELKVPNKYCSEHYRYRIGDPVLMIQNSRIRHAIPKWLKGERGKVIEIIPHKKGLRVEIAPGEIHDVTAAEVRTHVAPAYAANCHKAQGSEYKRVIVVLDNPAVYQTRAAFFTAVTRAKEHVYVLARDQETLQAAVTNDYERLTNVRRLLERELNKLS